MVTVSLMLGIHLLAYKPRCATSFEPAGIEDQRRFAGITSTAKRRDLSYTVVEQTLVVVTDVGAIHLPRIREDVGEADIRCTQR